MPYSIVVLDKVKSVKCGNIYSLQSSAELENGFVGIKGNLISGEREIYSFEKPVTANLGKSLVLIAEREINYSETKKSDSNLNKFFIPSNTACRGYEINNDDVFSTNAVDLISTTPTVGNYVVAQNNSYKLKEVASNTDVSGYGFVGRIIGKRTLGTTTVVGAPGLIGSVAELVEIEVVKN